MFLFNITVKIYVLLTDVDVSGCGDVFCFHYDATFGVRNEALLIKEKERKKIG